MASVRVDFVIAIVNLRYQCSCYFVSVNDECECAGKGFVTWQCANGRCYGASALSTAPGATLIVSCIASPDTLENERTAEKVEYNAASPTLHEYCYLSPKFVYRVRKNCSGVFLILWILLRSLFYIVCVYLLPFRVSHHRCLKQRARCRMPLGHGESYF